MHKKWPKTFGLLWNDWKGLDISRYGWKLLEITRNIWKGLNMAGKGWLISKNGWIWLETAEKAGNGWKLLDMAGNGLYCLKWYELTGNG